MSTIVRQSGFYSILASLIPIAPADRLAIVNWQNAGLMSKGGPSGAGITVVGGSRPTFTTISPSGLQDSTDVNAINTAIGNCPAGQVVKLAAGQFYIGPGNNYILLNKGITLRGAGANSTTITKVDGCRLETPFTGSQTLTVLTVTAMLGGRDLRVGDQITRQLTNDVPGGDTILSFGTGTGQTGTYNMSVSASVSSGTLQSGISTGANSSPAIVVGPSRDLGRWGAIGSSANSTSLTANANPRDMSIQVASTTNFSVGQFVLIDQLTTASWQRCTLPGNDTAAVLTASVSGTTMTVTAISAGSFGSGVLRQYMHLYGTEIPDGIFVVTQLTGTLGSTGDYRINASLSLSSRTVNAGYVGWMEPGGTLMWRKQRPAMTTGGNENFGWGIITGSISGTTLTLSSQDAGNIDVNWTVTATGNVPSPDDVTILSGGPTTWTLSSAPGNSSGQYEVHQWPITLGPGSGPAPGNFFHRQARPWCEIKEIANISGLTITFTSPVMYAYHVAQSPQMTFADLSDGIPVPLTQNAGVESLMVEQGDEGNISFRFAAYCWVKNVEARIYNGHDVNFIGCFRCEMRETYMHDACFPQPGGGAYNIGLEAGSSEILIEDCISVLADKTIISFSSGAGSVVAYNYMDQQYIDYTGDPGGGNCWVETGINSSHSAGSHHVLFEGNQGPNGDSDNNHGGSGHAFHFRNYYTIFRRPFLNLRNGVTYDDTSQTNGPYRAAATQSYNLNMTYIGNVLGTQGQMGGHGFVYDDALGRDPSVWLLGWDNNETPTRTSEPLARASTIRDGNWDWLQSVQSWHTTPGKFPIPNSIYLTNTPAFFGANTWPWVDPATGATYTLPAQKGLNDGTPNGP